MYYITLIDNFSRHAKVYLLRNKDVAGENFLMYESEAENQLK